MKTYRLSIDGLVVINVRLHEVYKKKLIADMQEIINETTEILDLINKIHKYISEQHWVEIVDIEEIYITKENE